MRQWTIATALFAFATLLSACGRDEAALDFSIIEGRTANWFFRDSSAAAHLVATSGAEPRLIVAFPAGNSGTGLWFEGDGAWSAPTGLHKIERQDGGIALIGVSATFSLAARQVTLNRADVGSLRFLRDSVDPALLPLRAPLQLDIDGDTARWQRERGDGNSRYRMELRMVAGSLAPDGDKLRLVADRQGEIRFTLEALTGDRPLTPIANPLNPSAGDDLRARQSLAFLGYREALLAGSWRFLTYFGRDSLLSLRLLGPALTPETVEAGLGAVIERMSPDGEVAHEEEVGELAVVHHLGLGDGASAQPIYDYGMVDDDFMLLPVLAEYQARATPAQAQAFLERRTSDGRLYRDAIAANADFVLAAARPFAAEPQTRNLVAIKPDRPTGNWRDSAEGLGRGRYPYDINVALVPAALDAIARLGEAGWLAPALIQEARAAAAVWRGHAPTMFDVAVDGKRFPALSLAGDGTPIPILHSDPGFALLFGAPEPTRLVTDLDAMMAPFPAGLMTPVGLLVANPVHASVQLQAEFTANHYHGQVVWSWQQAMLAAGLARQQQRTDLDPATRARIAEASAQLWRVIEATKEIRTSELWSWKLDDQGFAPVPFGQSGGDVTESNAAQLWSTVYLAIRPGD